MTPREAASGVPLSSLKPTAVATVATVAPPTPGTLNTARDAGVGMAAVSPRQGGRGLIGADGAARLAAHRLEWSRVTVVVGAGGLGGRRLARPLHPPTPSLLPLLHHFPLRLLPFTWRVMMSFLSQGCLRASWDSVTVSREPAHHPHPPPHTHPTHPSCRAGAPERRRTKPRGGRSSLLHTVVRPGIFFVHLSVSA